MDVDPYEEVTLHYTDYQSNGELLGGRTCICALCPVERESRDSQFNVLYNKLVNYSLKFPYAE